MKGRPRIGAPVIIEEVAASQLDRLEPLWRTLHGQHREVAANLRDGLPPADTWSAGRDVAELKMLVVADQLRGQGIGSVLMDAVDALLAAR